MKIEELLPSGRYSDVLEASFEAYAAFSSSIFDYWKGYTRDKEVFETLNLMKIKFLDNPDLMSQELKKLFTSFRSEVFIRTPRVESFLNYFYPDSVSDDNKLSSSSNMRALPRSTKLDSEIVDQTIKRWVEPGPKYDLDDMKSWLTQWVRYNRPYVQPDFYPITIGTSACLEYSRQLGGIRKRVQDMMAHNLSDQYQKQFDKDLLSIKRKSLSTVDLDPYKQSFHLIYTCLDLLRPCITHLRHCKDDCNNRSSHPPMVCLAVRFRGQKTRIPTMTIAPIVVLSKILRQVAELYLRTDPRIRPSLEGKVFQQLTFNSRDLYRSQDIKVATDHHEIEMTRHFYSEINPGVTWWQEAVDVVCNKYTILHSDQLRTYRMMRTFEAEGWFDKPFSFFMKDKFFSNFIKKNNPSVIKSFDEYVPLDWAHTHSRIGKVTKRGQPMGIATSWVLLPLVSIYSFERSQKNRQQITISRKVLETIDSYENLNLSKVVQNKVKKIVLTRTVPITYNNILTTGDDAIMRLSAFESELHTKYLNSVGSFISEGKDYLSPSYALYTELYYRDGLLMPIYPRGAILAPKQSSGCATWYSQPQAIQILEKTFNIKIDLKKSPYRYVWKLLAELGIPIGSSRLLHGLELFKYRNYGDRSRIGFQARLLFTKEFNNLLKLHPELPKFNFERDGLMTVPWNKDQDVRLKTHLTEMVKGDKLKQSLSHRTTLAPSPPITLKYRELDSIFRSSLTWDQFYRKLPDIDEEPYLSEYINIFSLKYNMKPRLVSWILEDTLNELETTVDIPLGVYERFKPTFGLLLPRSQCPMFFYNDRDHDLRTAYVFFSKET